MAGLGLTFGLRALRALGAASLAAVWALSAPAQAAAPAEDALKRIIEEGNPAYLDWSAATGDRDQIGKLYEDNGYRLLWSDGEKPTAAAIGLLQQLRLAAERGLDPEDYPGNGLVYLLIDLIDAPQAGIEQWALFDAGLSRAGLRFLSDVHLGRIDPAAMGHDLSVGRIKLDLPTTLAHLAGAVDVAAAVDSLEPQVQPLRALERQAVAIPGAGGRGWAHRLAASAREIGEARRGLFRGGQTAASAGRSRRRRAGGTGRAAAVPDAAAGRRPEAFPEPAWGKTRWRARRRHVHAADQALERAGAADRAHHGALALAALGTRDRTHHRQHPAISPVRLRIHVRCGGSNPQMDVIVGKSFDSTQTPVFAADMSYLIFRPYWEVPYSIALKEIVPTARNNPADIERRQMEIVSGGGDSATVMPNTRENVELVARGTLRLRQRPGPNNSLGLVKFMMPNPYNVYLHSTPAQSLFAETRRDFSHGCVRVSDPIGLAQHVLRDAPEWTREKIISAMNGSQPLTVTLKNRIRVFIVYGTAIATEKGNILFFDDIYRHDERLAKALEARRARGAVNLGGGAANARRRCRLILPGRADLPGLLALPGPKRPGIQVHEIRLAIISHPAPLQALGMGGEAGAIDAGQAYVDGAALHVQTVLGDALALLAQPGVGLRRPVA